MIRLLAVLAALFLAGCTETGRQAPAPAAGPASPSAVAPAASRRMPSTNEQACLAAVSRTTNNGDVILLDSATSEANDTVIVGVGPQRARWRCLAKDGKVAEVMSLTNEGRL
jgi:hypothetical protein